MIVGVSKGLTMDGCLGRAPTNPDPHTLAAFGVASGDTGCVVSITGHSFAGCDSPVINASISDADVPNLATTKIDGIISMYNLEIRLTAKYNRGGCEQHTSNPFHGD